MIVRVYYIVNIELFIEYFSGEAETSILNEHSKSYESDENNTTLAQADNTASSVRKSVRLVLNRL